MATYTLTVLPANFQFGLEDAGLSVRRGLRAEPGVFVLQGGDTRLGGITEAEFRDWLSQDNPRAVLAEVSVYGNAGPESFYFSNYPYISATTDTPANTPYDDVLADVPGWRTGIDASLSVGEVSVMNESGERDAWLDKAWDGWPIALYLGDPDWPKREFRQILAGTMDGLTAPSAHYLSIAVRDKKESLNKPVQTNLYETGDNEGQPIPLCLGYCENVEPVLVDAAHLIYQVHDGPIRAIIQVRDNGVPVAVSTDLENGKFALLAAPEGRITATVQGAITDWGFIDRAPEFIRYLATRGPLTDADLDLVNFAEIAVECPQTLGLYIRERRNHIEVYDEIMATLGGYWYFNRLGRMRLWRLSTPSGTPVAEFVADDVAEQGLTVSGRTPALGQIKLGVQRRWTVQDKDSLAGSVSAAYREYWGNEYTPAVATDSLTATAHPGAEKPDEIGTLFAAPTLAAAKAFGIAEAERRLALTAGVRLPAIYRAELFARGYQLELGNVVKLTHPRFGFAAGELAVVVGIEERPTRGRMTLELWR
jgi:hypothetical protein